MSPSTASPVLTATKKGTAYLEVVQQPDGKIRVQRTEAGKSLNGFWTVWLRDLLLNRVDSRHGLAVELRDRSVVVSADMTPPGLRETVRQIAAQITPLPNPPMRRRDVVTTGLHMSWEVNDGVDLTECLATLRLPREARMTCRGGFVNLWRKPRCKFRIGQLAQMVEYHVATTWQAGSAKG